MNTRQLTQAWIASICVFWLFCALAFYVDNHTPPILQTVDLDETDTVVIGSSLTHAAIPAFEVGGSLFDDGRRHKMLLVGGITEAESLAIIDHAISRGVSTLIVEANDHLYERVRKDWRERIGWSAAGVVEQFHRGIRLLEGSQSTEVRFREGEFPELTGTMKVRRKKFKPRYRLQVRNGSDELAELVNRARDNGIEFLMFLPPSSNYYNDSLRKTILAVKSQADRLAEGLDVALWKDDEPWDNALFRDVIHLNVHGRARFVGELKDWLRGASDKVASSSRGAVSVASGSAGPQSSQTARVVRLFDPVSSRQQAGAR